MEPRTVFRGLAQRVVYSYLRQLPDEPALSGPSEMQASQIELHGFFCDYYQRAYDQPETFGLPVTEDLCTGQGASKEEKRAVATQTKKVRVKMGHGLDFVYLAGQQGKVVDRGLEMGREDYDAFLSKNARAKRKSLDGLREVGLGVDEEDGVIRVTNTRYPHMMPALQALVKACQARDDKAAQQMLFARCDLRALEPDYWPEALDVLRAVMPSSAYEHAVRLHHMLGEMGYKPNLRFANVFDWKVEYQGSRKIKSTPFFEFEYDDRQKVQLVMRVKCASTNRLVPLLSQQPVSLQQDFYEHAHNCGAPKCDWCKTRKSLGPSVLEWDDSKKTICWWMQRHFRKVNGEAVEMVRHYALFHEALVAT